MGSGIPQDTAAVMSVALEGMLYGDSSGFSVLLFIGTIWALINKRHIQDVHLPTALVAVLLFLLSTAHMIVDIIRVEDGLVKYRDTFPGGPAAFFADVAQVTYVTKDLIFILQTLLGDAVVIYRCYVVWQSLWVIIVPSVLWCSSAGKSQSCSRSPSARTGSIFATTTALWVTAFFALSVSTNLMSSGLLAYRIWVIERTYVAFRSIRGPNILRVLVDAAALYSVAFFATLVCFALSNNGEVVLLYLLPPLVSIAFYMVLIRIAMRRKNQSYLSNIRAGATNQTQPGTLPRYSMPLEVRISQFTHDDGTPSYGIGDQVRPPTCKAESVRGSPC
ncbi:hypothetical protein M405DRAFT_731004 [Rhizopogon salebrosus TDB-379]|nr:hypothetical protein M405DRAFT_731004 [Rhizopogon salebrosus TDB-379]